MKPALFIFADDNGSSCVYVHKCDLATAYTMITNTVTHEWAPSLERFCAEEYSALFIAANKKKPFDMIVTGEFDETDKYEDVDAVYEIYKSHDGKAIHIMPVTSDDGVTSIWELRKTLLH